METRRSSGILLHISSLPSKYGIGDFGQGAYDFLDKLLEAGQSLWQVLPLGPTGYGDSPYQSFSVFAGNELFISPDILLSEGYLTDAEIRDYPRFPADETDYGPVIDHKNRLLDRAAARFASEAKPPVRAAFERFCADEASWLDDYSLFMSAKAAYGRETPRYAEGGANWAATWPLDLVTGKGESVERFRKDHAENILKRKALQYLFRVQYEALKAKANAMGISIVGDVPIFVAYDSADVWQRRDLFLLDEKALPVDVAGVPPDYFSEDGQLWGNPLYAWEEHARTGYDWWCRRLAAAFRMFDMIRLDHFRGFEAFWAVPFGERTARNGEWRKAPGDALFAALDKRFDGKLPIIAEDLGFITREVHELRARFGFPGMRILQFAFNAEESGSGLSADNHFLPHNYAPDSVAYTGTHDNETLRGWLDDSATKGELAYIDEYLGFKPESRTRAMIRETWKSTARIAVIPMQDILDLGNEARMNTPSTIGGRNWRWRMLPGAFTPELRAWVRKETSFFGRNAAP